MISQVTKKGERKEWTAKLLEQFTDMLPIPGHKNREEWMGYLPHTQHALEQKRTGNEEAPANLPTNVGESFPMLGKY